MSLSTIIFALSITVICTVHAGDGVNNALDEYDGNANDRSLRRLKGSSWAQELKEVNEVQQELAALSAANDALRDEILAEYLYDEEDSSYYDDDNADEAFMDWFESLSADEQQYYFDEMMPETAAVSTLSVRPEENKGYATTGMRGRHPAWCDRILVHPKIWTQDDPDMQKEYGDVQYFSIDKGDLVVKSDHDMVVGYLPNAEGMKVLIVTWNIDNQEEEKTNINAKNLLTFIQSSVNAKQTDLFYKADLYFFSFQEVGSKLAAETSKWNFLGEFNKIKFLNEKGEKVKKTWGMESMSGHDVQGTVGFIVYDSTVITKKTEDLIIQTGLGGSKKKKAFMLSMEFQKGENKPLTFAAAHLPFKPFSGPIPCSPKEHPLTLHGRPSRKHNCGLDDREKAMDLISEKFGSREGSLILAGDLNFRVAYDDGEQLRNYMLRKNIKTKLRPNWKEIKTKVNDRDLGHPDFDKTCKRSVKKG